MKKHRLLVSALACVLAGTSAWAQVPSLAASASAAPMKLLDWVQANATVGRHLRGHVDILKLEDAAGSDQSHAALTGTLSVNQALRLALKAHPELRNVSGARSPAEQLENYGAVIKLSHRVIRAWIEAVAAKQAQAFLQSEYEGAQVGAELAQRMVQVGNWSQMQHLQEQLVLADATIALTLAQQKTAETQQHLVQVLGLAGDASAITLPDNLPDLAKTPHDASRVDAMALAADTQRLGSTPDLQQAIAALALLKPLTPAARSQIQQARLHYRSADTLARLQRDERLPLLIALQDETQARYNGMLQSTWDLLNRTRAKLQGARAAAAAQADFWLAHIDLQRTLAISALGEST